MTDRKQPDESINTKIELDFEQRARAVRLEDIVGDDSYATAAEIIFLRDRNIHLQKEYAEMQARCLAAVWLIPEDND